MTTYNNLTLDELKNEAERSDNLLAQAIMTAQDNDDSQDEYLEELEAAIAEHLSDKIEESLNSEKPYYTDPESDRYEYMYEGGYDVNEQQFDTYIESLDLDDNDLEFVEKYKTDIIDELEENKDTYFTAKIHGNYWAPKEALICDSIGEIEIEMEYHLEDIDFLSDSIKAQTFKNISEWYIDDTGTYAYLDMSSDSICLCINPDSLADIITLLKERME